MKFFTRAWTEGELDDATAERIPELYREHLAAILDALPVAARRLATELNLHDALIRAVVLDRPAEKLVLALRCGDLGSGYFDIDLEYGNVEITPDFVSTLRELADHPDAEVLYDEVDLSEGPAILHRLLFAPHGEIELRFRELAIRVERRTEREVERKGFVELEVDAGR